MPPVCLGRRRLELVSPDLWMLRTFCLSLILEPWTALRVESAWARSQLRWLVTSFRSPPSVTFWASRPYPSTTRSPCSCCGRHMRHTTRSCGPLATGSSETRRPKAVRRAFLEDVTEISSFRSLQDVELLRRGGSELFLWSDFYAGNVQRRQQTKSGGHRQVINAQFGFGSIYIYIVTVESPQGN